jgi:hypothetical protein
MIMKRHFKSFQQQSNEIESLKFTSHRSIINIIYIHLSEINIKLRRRVDLQAICLER